MYISATVTDTILKFDIILFQGSRYSIHRYIQIKTVFFTDFEH